MSTKVEETEAQERVGLNTKNRLNAHDFADIRDASAEALNAALEAGDMRRIMSILTDMARVRGISQIAQDTGLGRESLYKSMRPSSRPGFDTVLKVVQSLGLEIKASPRSPKITSTPDSPKAARPASRRSLA